MTKIQILMLGMITLVGCQKMTKESVPNDSEMSKRNTFVNPYEFVGEIHNIGLESAILDDEYLSLSDMDKLSFMHQITASEYQKRNLSYSGFGFTEEDTDFETNRNLDCEEIFDHYYDLLNARQKGYMAEVETLLDNVSGENSLLHMNELEEDIYNDSNLSSDDKNALLASIALARNSAIFWDEHPEYQGFNGVWKADWGGFWAGYHMGEVGFTWWEQVQHGVEQAEFASEEKRQERNFQD